MTLLTAALDGYVKIDVPASWKDAVDDSTKHVATGDRPELVDYVNNVVYPGQHLPRARICRFPPLKSMLTAPPRRAPLLMRSAALQLTFRVDPGKLYPV
jgi:hypothetical protein